MKDDRDHLEAMTRRLAEMVTNKDLVESGRVHTIDLKELRRKLGAGWAGAEEAVHAAMARGLRRRLSPKDVWFRSGATEYVVVFANLASAAASMVCARIAEDAHQQALGVENAKDTVRVRTAVAASDGRLIARKAGLDGILRRARLEGETVKPAETPARVRTYRGSALVVSRLRRPVAPANEPEPEAQPPSPIELKFQPIWDVRHQVISTYLCCPHLRGADGTLAGIIRVPGAVEGEAARVEDIAVLNGAIDTLAELYRNKFRLVLMIPVNLDTLSRDRGQREYLAACHRIEEELRGFVAFLLRGVTDNTPLDRLLNPVAVLKPYARWIFLDSGLRQPSRYQPLIRHGLTGIGAELAAPMPTGEAPFTRIERFAEEAERARLLCLLQGVADSPTAVAARAAGIGFIAGSRIGPVDDIPQTMQRFSWIDLFRKEQGG